jgi:hypothetical protein
MAVDAGDAAVPVAVVTARCPRLPMLAWGETLGIDIDGTTIAPLAILEVGHLNGELPFPKRRRRANCESRRGDQGDGEQVWDQAHRGSRVSHAHSVIHHS